MKNLLLYGLLLLALLTACAPKQPAFTPQDEAAITADVQTKVDELLSNAENFNTDAMQKYLSDDQNATFYMGGKSYKKADLIEAVKKEYEPFASQKLTVINQKVIVISQNALLWKSELKSSATAKDGKTDEIVLNETWLWQKIGDSWKVTHFDEYW